MKKSILFQVTREERLRKAREAIGHQLKLRDYNSSLIERDELLTEKLINLVPEETLNKLRELRRDEGA